MRRQKIERNLGTTAALALVALLAGGCASGPTPKEQLAAAYKQLGGPNPNYVEMAQAADAYLKDQPTGAARADAFYLRGRAMEEKAQRDPAAPQRDWAEA
jgi:hypothetical protein